MSRCTIRLATVILLLQCLSGVTSLCSLPAFLSSRPRWESLVILERRVIGAIWIFSEHSATMTNMTTRDQPTTTYTCSEVGSSVENIFLTTLHSSINGSNQQTVYQYLQFFQRSPNVIQLARSAMIYNVDDLSGGLPAITKDEFLLVWPNPDTDSLSNCGVVGGYTFSLADATGNELCADSFLMPIMEVDCSGGTKEGISLDFRQLNCMGGLKLSLQSHVYCIGTWSETNFTFTVLSDRNEQWPKLWMLRLPVLHGRREFVGHVMTSIAAVHDADPMHAASPGSAYAIRAMPTSFPSLCADEASTCDAAHCADADYYGGEAEVHCQKTCDACANDTGCSFVNNTRGTWLEASSERGSRLVEINETSLNIGGSGGGLSVCVELSSDRWSTAATRRPVATLFPDTGCRPQLTCYDFVRQNDAVLVYRSGRRVQWPTPTLPLTSSAVCGDELFSVDPTNPADSASPIRVLVKYGVNTAQSTVPCGFIGWFQLNGQLSTGNNVTARIDPCDLDYHSFNYVEIDGLSWTSQTHRCLASFSLPLSNDQYVITTVGDGGPEELVAYCWLFQQSVWDARPRVYLTLAADCNADTSLNVRHRANEHYIAQFDIVPPSTTSSSLLVSLSRDCAEPRTLPVPPSTTTRTSDEQGRTYSAGDIQSTRSDLLLTNPLTTPGPTPNQIGQSTIDDGSATTRKAMASQPVPVNEVNGVQASTSPELQSTSTIPKTRGVEITTKHQQQQQQSEASSPSKSADLTAANWPSFPTARAAGLQEHVTSDTCRHTVTSVPSLLLMLASVVAMLPRCR